MVSKKNLGGSLAIIPYLVNRYFSGTKIVTGVAFDRFRRETIVVQVPPSRINSMGCQMVLL
jgi:hypothetical protein